MTQANKPILASQTMLAFKSGKNEYAIRSVRTEGLCGYERVMPISGTPDFLIGVMQVGGIMAPVVDMRVQFEPGVRTADSNMSVLIINVNGRVIGIAVSHFCGVVRLTDEQIQPASKTQEPYAADYLLGLGCIDQRKIHLIDIDKMLACIKAVFLLEKAAA